MKCARRISVFLATFALCAVFAAPLGAQLTLLVPQHYPTIQAAIDAASPGDTVLVDDDTYLETIDFLGKAITVTSVNGAGSTTIDAFGAPGSVVKFEGCGPDSVLNGFTITHGTGTFYENNLRGGGIFCESSTPVISNNVIVDNSVPFSYGGRGGGLYCHSSAPTFVNNVVQGNHARKGGGCGIDDSEGLFAGNDFVQNFADMFGGALHCDSSSPSIEGNSFIANTTLTWDGGAIRCKSSSPSIEGNSFVGNSAYGGGAIALSDSNAVISLNILTDNSAAFVGGAIQNNESSPNIDGNTFEGNSAEGCGAINMYGGAGTVTDNEFTGNMALTYGGGALTCQAFSVAIVEGNTFTNNVAAAGGGAIGCWDNGYPTLRGNTIVGNSANYGAGVYAGDGTDMTLTDDLVLGNIAAGVYGDGGGLTADPNSVVVVTNCCFSGNSAELGGAINVWNSQCTITNSTFSENSATVMGGGIRGTGSASATIVTNSILWAGQPDQIAQEGGAIVDVTYSDVQGGWPGAGNIDQDPRFVNAAGTDGIPGTLDDDLHIGPVSPCVNGGTNGALGLPATDFEGDPRIICEFVDIGADEALAPPGGCGVLFVRGDVNQDGLFDIADAISSLGALFVTGSPTPDCMDAADANDDGSFDIGDPISVLSTLFVVGSPPLPAPHPDCGTDPTPDGLGCAAFDLTACP